MEGHKRQAISSQFAPMAFKGQECLNSCSRRAEATFQLLLHNIFLRQTCVVNASHYSKMSCLYDFSIG